MTLVWAGSVELASAFKPWPNQANASSAKQDDARHSDVLSVPKLVSLTTSIPYQGAFNKASAKTFSKRLNHNVAAAAFFVEHDECHAVA